MVAFDPNTGLLPCVAELEHENARDAIAYMICRFAHGSSCDCEHRARNARAARLGLPVDAACVETLKVADGVLVLAQAYQQRGKA